MAEVRLRKLRSDSPRSASQPQRYSHDPLMIVLAPAAGGVHASFSSVARRTLLYSDRARDMGSRKKVSALSLCLPPAAEHEWLPWWRGFGGSERARWEEDGELFAATVARVHRCSMDFEAARVS